LHQSRLFFYLLTFYIKKAEKTLNSVLLLLFIPLGLLFYYFAPHAGQTWCGRFFSPHTLHTPHGITDNASCERRCALRALLVLLFGVAILYPFYFITVLF